MSVRVVVRTCLLTGVLGCAIVTSVPAQTAGIREVTASPRTLIPLQTRLRYTTMIVLPEGEDSFVSATSVAAAPYSSTIA
jgi:hypothetical protein